MKSELEDMKQEIYQKRSANSTLTQAHETRLKEAEERIEEAETWLLQIQRAHRAVARKPERNAPPRSIVVNFLEFTTKERVLKKAWEKKILMEGRRLSFDHDYATEVVLKRKEYVGIKRVLKEKNIRFQTPLDRMRIHWDSGTRTYDSAQDAAQELRRRGFSVEIPDRNASELYPEMERLHQTKTWHRVGESSAGGAETTSRVRKRLQEYEWIPPGTN
ncbi:hypothetical protein JOQ06_001273 [Pogonophryne albipinna]|uniref:Transposase n=1 Tax=Pogonophryne albipinna TaxID=1090488 RepID=A0AAD6FIM1_9TELE|nr:hypothetical protein JOQ06_001273 [Pogonophryne albipinna]